MTVRFRAIAALKYQQALRNMGLRHAADWDCGNSDCQWCQPFRVIEQAVYNGLSDQEKHEVRFFRWDV